MKPIHQRHREEPAIHISLIAFPRPLEKTQIYRDDGHHWNFASESQIAALVSEQLIDSFFVVEEPNPESLTVAD